MQIVVPPEANTPLTSDEYAWVMHWAKRGGPPDPDETDRYRTLRARLDERLSPSEHRERTAYSVAATAVVAKALGLGVPQVLIRDDGSGEAAWSEPVPLNPPTADEALRDLQTFATISAAGYVAEQVQWQHARAPKDKAVAQVVMKLRELYEIERPMPAAVQDALS